MRDDRQSDEKVAQTNTSRSINRRRFVKALGVAGGTMAFSTGVTQPVLADAPENGSKPDIEVTDVSWRKYSTTTLHQLDSASRTGYERDLVEEMRAEGVTPDHSNTLTADVATNNDDANSVNPQLTVLPFTSEYDDTKGLLHLLSGENEGERTTIAAFGATTTSPESSERREVKLFGNVADKNEDPQAGQIRTTTPDVGGSDSGVSTQAIGCAPCKAIANSACGLGISNGTRIACLELSAGCLGGSPILATGCLGACLIILGAVNGYACTQGAEYVCRQVNFC